jgi:hypothetical protein
VSARNCKESRTRHDQESRQSGRLRRHRQGAEHVRNIAAVRTFQLLRQSQR